MLAHENTGKSIKLTEEVFTSSNAKIVGRNTLYKLADHSAGGKMNIFSLSNTEIHIRHLQNTYMTLDNHFALWNVSWILYILSSKDNLYTLGKVLYPF
jgi:hypothetical protein